MWPARPPIMDGFGRRRSDAATLRRSNARSISLSAVESLKALTPIGEPPAVFAALRALGLRLGVATNDSEQSARRQVEALGVRAHVEFVAGYDLGHGGKPDPGMALAFARLLEADPSQIVMVGDLRHDLDCARRPAPSPSRFCRVRRSASRSSRTPISSSTTSAICRGCWPGSRAPGAGCARTGGARDHEAAGQISCRDIRIGRSYAFSHASEARRRRHFHPSNREKWRRKQEVWRDLYR